MGGGGCIGGGALGIYLRVISGGGGGGGCSSVGSFGIYLGGGGGGSGGGGIKWIFMFNSSHNCLMA